MTTPGAPRSSVMLLAGLLTVTPALAQGRIANAVTETRSAARGLESEVRGVAARAGAAWIGYRVPMVAGPSRICCSDSRGDADFCCATCRLDGGGGVSMIVGDPSAGSTRRITLEPPADLLVFARVEAGQTVRLRTFTPDCDVDAAGASLVWLTDVRPDQSVAWLATLIDAAPESAIDRDRVARPAMAAVALHESPEGVPLLIRLARTSQRIDVRRQAMFWLGQSHDARAVAFFEEILRSR